AEENDEAPLLAELFDKVLGSLPHRLLVVLLETGPAAFDDEARRATERLQVELVDHLELIGLRLVRRLAAPSAANAYHANAKAGAERERIGHAVVPAAAGERDVDRLVLVGRRFGKDGERRELSNH